MAHDFRSRMLRRRDDALVNPTIRSGSSWYNLPCLSSTIGCHDCGGNPHKQDGTGATTSIRSDARSTMGHLYGQLRERRRILSLQLLGHKRMRQDCTGGYLCTRMPTHCGSSDVRYLSAAKEDEAHKNHKNVVQEVKRSSFGVSRRAAFMLAGFRESCFPVQIEPILAEPFTDLKTKHPARTLVSYLQDVLPILFLGSSLNGFSKNEHIYGVVPRAWVPLACGLKKRGRGVQLTHHTLPPQ